MEIAALLEKAGLVRGCGAGKRWENYNRAVKLVREWRDGMSPSVRPRDEEAMLVMAKHLGGR